MMNPDRSNFGPAGGIMGYRIQKYLFWLSILALIWTIWWALKGR